MEQKSALVCKSLLLLFAAIFFAGCQHLPTPTPLDQQYETPVQSEVTMERVSFTTTDGVTIVGTWYPVTGATRVALLLHMMPSTKESWQGLARELNTRGMAALAIDLRGHGESVKKGVGSNGERSQEMNNINFQKFSDAEHQESIGDVRAALEWLGQRGFEAGQVRLAGASIGANLALQVASENLVITRIVMLSPGLDYRGVQTEPAIAALLPDASILIVAARGDEYAATSSETLKHLQPQAALSILDGSAHGTDLFDDHKEMQTQIADFLSR